MATASEDDQNETPEDSPSNTSSDIEGYTERYAVFCTTQIPPEKLNNLITAVREHCPPSTGTVLRVVSSESEIASSSLLPADGQHDGGTRVPVADFETPFIGWSISALQSVFSRDTEESQAWAHSCFAVLDERFLKDGTVLLVSSSTQSAAADDNDDDDDDIDDGEQVLNHRCDAEITLDLLLAYETNRIGVDPGDADWDSVFTVSDFDKHILGR